MKKLSEIHFIAIEASIEAGIAIMKIFDSDDFGIQHKKDDSPVTKADLVATGIISRRLKNTQIPVLSEEEEQADYSVRKKWKKLWVVDPLDGTKEFIKKTHEFTVNIGLVKNKKPVFGVIYIPASKEVFFGNKKLGAYKFMCNSQESIIDQIKNAIKLPLKKISTDFVIVTGGSESDFAFFQKSPLIFKLGITNMKFSRVSSSIKFCRLAEGEMDVYPRFYPCMEWDTAAGHAIVKGIGKEVYNIETNKKLKYNKRSLFNPNFVCHGINKSHWRENIGAE